MRMLLFVIAIIAFCSCSRKMHGGSGKETGIASYYGGKYEGRKTANGEIFRASKLTAAHKTLPFGTKVKVTNLSNGKTVKVRINDRGPFVQGRIIDLSESAAKKIGMITAGITKVTLRY